MRRAVRLTSVLFLVALTTSVVTGAAVAASPRRTPAPPKRASTSAKKAPAKVKPGSAWTVRSGTLCEMDSFATHRAFAATDNGSGDSGTYKGTKKITMTFTAGPAAGDLFTGTFSKSGDDYAGTYSHGGQNTPGTLTPAANAGCDVVTTTTNSSIAFGQSDADDALVTGEADVTPTGDMEFFVCPSPATPSDPCLGSSPSVIDLGTSALSGSGATASTESPSFSPQNAGFYCFGAVYDGDGHYPVTPEASAQGECFSVSKANSSVHTAPEFADIVIGSSDDDKAGITAPGIALPTGSVIFYICGPDQTETACTASAGSEVGSSTVTSGQGGSTATSPDVVPKTTGTYCFLGIYSGDENYNGSADSSTTDECFKVLSKPPPS